MPPKLAVKASVLKVNLLGLRYDGPRSSRSLFRTLISPALSLAAALCCISLSAAPASAHAQPPATAQPAAQAATQAADKPADRKIDLASRLEAAEQASRLHDPTLKPWHLKLAVQLYDTKGNPSEQATIEEWWSPDNDKRVYTSPSYTATEIRHGKELYRTAGQPKAPYQLQFALQQAVDPFANVADVRESKPEMRTETFGKVKLDCITLSDGSMSLVSPRLDAFPTYCFEPMRNTLRLFEFAGQIVSYNQFGTFQARSVGINTRIRILDHVASSSVETLSTWVVDPSVFVPDSGLADLGYAPVSISVSSAKPQCISKRPPEYPQEAKAKFIGGTVLLGGTIGTDGLMHDLEVITTPDSSLAAASIASVSKWVFKPYIVDGEPRTVDTQIAIHFNIR